MVRKPESYEILNLGMGDTIELKRMISTIGDSLGVEPNIDHLPLQPGDVERTFADINKAQALIGYSPSVDFDTGIPRFVEWYQEHRSVGP